MEHRQDIDQVFSFIDSVHNYNRKYANSNFPVIFMFARVNFGCLLYSVYFVMYLL